METPFVSVVITVLNMDKTISKCLDSLLELNYPEDKYEVVIVDGGSADKTIKIIKDYIAKSKKTAISLYFRKGWPSAGRNEALRHVKGEYIAVTDADMVVGKNWLRDYVDVLKELDDEKVAGIGGPNNTATSDLSSRSVACIPTHGPTNDEVPIFGKNRYTKDFVSTDFIYATVCRNSFYRKKALLDVDGFDERFFGAEDPELNYRILEKGWKLAYTRKAPVRHYHHSTVSRFYRQQRKYALWQAVANKVHPKMKSALHPMPFLAALGMVGIFLLTVLFRAGVWYSIGPAPLLFHIFAYLLGIALILAIAAFLGYGLKCSIAKKDAALFISVPFFTFVWQLAWVTGYPAGLIQRDRLLAGDPRLLSAQKKKGGDE